MHIPKLVNQVAGFVISTILLPYLTSLVLGPSGAIAALIIFGSAWILSHERIRPKTNDWSNALAAWGRRRRYMSFMIITVTGAVLGSLLFATAWKFGINNLNLPVPAVPSGNGPSATPKPTAKQTETSPLVGPKTAKAKEERKARGVGLRITEQKEITSLYLGEKYALQVTIETDKTIQPVHLRVQCDGPLVRVDLREPQRLFQYSYGVVPGEPDVAEVTFNFPPMDRDRPVVLALIADKKIKATAVRNVQ